MKDLWWKRTGIISCFVLLDYNDDGVKEIGVKFGHIVRIFFYQGKGKWRAI